MENQQLIQEIVQSNEVLRIQIWILGGALLALVALATWFAAMAWMDMKAVSENHAQRLILVEKNQAVYDYQFESHENRLNNLEG